MCVVEKTKSPRFSGVKLSILSQAEVDEVVKKMNDYDWEAL